MTTCPGAEAGQIGRARLAVGPRRTDLKQDVGGERLVPRGDDLRALVHIQLVGKASRPGRPRSGSRTSRPALVSEGTVAGDQGDALFAGKRLLSNCNSHNLPQTTHIGWNFDSQMRRIIALAGDVENPPLL